MAADIAARREPTASAVGTGNTVVQIFGDGNHVVAGHAHLVLTRYLARNAIRHDLDLLSPYTRSTPLIGRQREMNDLQGFLGRHQPLQVRVLTGGGGSGKTRLALELCDAAIAQGWAAGFVGRKELRRFFDQQNLSEWGWCKPTLIVVDYAAEQAQLLGQWLEELADRPSPEHPLRMLLLERSASIGSGWWAVVFESSGWAAASKHALLDPPEPVSIEPLLRVEDRLEALKAMLGNPGISKSVEITLNEAELRDRLMHATWGGDPLFLMMSALTMDRLGHTKALTMGRTDLADELAKREADLLRRRALANGLSPELVQHLAAIVTLAQGMSREDFERFAAEEKQAAGRPSGGDVAALADLLQQALPRPNAIAPILPDLIGEALLALTLKDNTGTAAVLRCYRAFGQAVAETVIRCAQDFAASKSAPLLWLQAIVGAAADDDEALAALDASLPIDSIALTEVNLRVANRLVELRSSSAHVAPEVRASALNGLAIARANAGQRENALLAAQEAVDLYRHLTALRPEVFQPKLAGSLNTLANLLSDLGNRDSALLAATESVELYRKLVAQRTEVFWPDLAASLNNLANMHSSVGEPENALLASREAVALYRELAALRPDVFLPNLAMSLSNLANRLGDLGQREPALLSAQEAVDLYRQLCALRPDVFQPDLAMALNTLANRLSSLGQRERALIAANETLKVYRELAVLRPYIFRPYLATSLHNLANRLSDLAQPEPALEAAKEAVDIRRELASVRPDVFRPDLAGSLNNLAPMLSNLGQRAAALLAANEAVALYRELATLRPEVFRPNLAMSLYNLAPMLSDLGHAQPALLAAKEAVEHYRELAAARPDVYRSDLAGSLNNLANILGDLGQRESALQAAKQAVFIRRELEAVCPDVYWPDLAASLNNLANRLGDMGQRSAALQAAQEAAKLYRELAAQRPDVYLPNLAMSLNTLAGRFGDLFQHGLAQIAAQEAILLYRGLAEAHPELFQPALAGSLTNLANLLRKLGLREPALQAARESVELYRAVGALHHDLFRPDLARSLCALALATDDCLTPIEAAPIAAEAVSILAPAFFRSSDAHRGLMGAVINTYQALCNKAGIKVDGQLMTPLHSYFLTRNTS